MKHDYLIEILDDDGLVKLTVPWRPFGYNESLGIWVYFLDLRKGSLPIKGNGKWERRRSNGKTSWRLEDFEVIDSTLVDDVWMPIVLRESVRASTRPDLLNKYETCIKLIEYGRVQSNDIEV